MTKWLQGKKTYFSAVALFLVAVLGWWVGAVNGVQATGMIAAAFGLAGLGARSTRYAEMTLAALEEIKKDKASGKKLDADEVKRIVCEFATWHTGTVVPGNFTVGISTNSPSFSQGASPVDITSVPRGWDKK